jgi:ATP-dependent RNA helicase DDX5/DBP2
MLARSIIRIFNSSNHPKQASSFDSLGFPSFITKVLEESSFVEPTPIQAQTWPILIDGKDVIGIAQTGSGKTLAYAIPSLMKVIQSFKNNLASKKHQPPTNMIVLPTRELCQQVSLEYRKFAFKAGIKVGTVYGGEPKAYQISIIASGIHTIIGTPGRMLDLASGNQLNLSQINYLVLDEADMMLDMGFEDQIRAIIALTKKTRQTIMFTATWPREIQLLANEFLSNPTKVTIGNSDLTMNPNIVHKFKCVSNYDKDQSILDILSSDPQKKVLVFTNTKKEADSLKNYLDEFNIKSDVLHSEKTQMIRSLVMKNFKNDLIKVVIATDVASRGLDIKDVDMVINYSIPNQFDSYIHRVGRTARGGATGTAITFVNQNDNPNILKKIKTSINKVNQTVPDFIDEIIQDHNL